MKLFDLHSDTLYEAYHRKISPVSSELLQAPLGISPFDETYRVSAIWCNKALDDESAWNAYHAIWDSSQNALAKEALPQNVSLIHAVEDARLLNGNLDRLETLCRNGTRILTLTWQGLSSVGGAWDTDEGLTDFGKALVRSAKALPLILDISHASEKTARKTLAISEQCDVPVTASHSVSLAVCPHRRNLSDYLFDALAERGAPVGISMVSDHLNGNMTATLDTLLSHIAHFLSRKNGEYTLAIGSDFDGTDRLPEGISSLNDLPKLYAAIANAFSKPIADKIFFENAHTYFTKQTV